MKQFSLLPPHSFFRNTANKVFLLLLLFILSIQVVTGQNMVPTEIIIRGYDSDVRTGRDGQPTPAPCVSDAVILTATSEITTGYFFNITNNTSAGNMFGTWDDNLNNTTFTYYGTDTIVVGDNLCIVAYCIEEGGEVIIKRNGIDVTNEFTIDHTHGLIFSEGVSQKSNLYITKGEFKEFGGHLSLVGNVLDGLVIAPASDSIAPPYPLTNNKTIIRDEDPGSAVYYIQCVELDDCDPTISLMTKDDWIRVDGTPGNDIDLEELCDSICNFECNDVIEFLETTEEICNKSVCFPANLTLLEEMVIDGQPLSGQSPFTFPYCIAPQCPSGCSGVNYPCADPNFTDHLAQYLDEQNIIYSGISFNSYGNSLCLDISIEDLDVSIVVGGSSRPTTYNLGTIECDDVLMIEPQISCTIEEHSWSNGKIPIRIPVYNNTPITIDLQCTDGCRYSGEYIPNIFIPKAAVTSSEGVVHSSDMTIWPNPAINSLYLDLNSELDGQKAIIKIANTNGQIVHIEDVNTPIRRHQISTESLPNGIYILLLSTQDSQFSQKFTVSK